MAHAVETIDRIAPSRRPHRPACGYHCWSNLLFVHWRVPPVLIEPLLPEGLTLDTWDGDAWVGLVPFYMSRVRPWWSPPVPGVSNFCETNVRTYVHFRGRDPGVWFLSLDASSSLAVRIARWRWHLPYFRARMELTRNTDRVHYASERLWPRPGGAGCRVEAAIGPSLGEGDPARRLPAGRALPETLEHFLVERYILYSCAASGELLRGQVHHTPYPIRQATLLSLEEALLPAAGILDRGEPCHALFSDGVNVDVFPLRPVT